MGIYDDPQSRRQVETESCFACYDRRPNSKQGALATRQRGQMQPQPAAMDEQLGEQEPVSPAGRVFYQPKMCCNIVAIFEFRDEIDIPRYTQVLGDTIAKHKRFSSVLVDRKGHHVWRRVKVNIDDHIIVPSLSDEQKSSPTCAEDYAAELALAPPLDPSRPLWELHILEPKSGIFRIHHSLGDGTSLMSLFMACTRKLDHPDELPSMEPRKKQSRESSFDLRRSIWTLLLVLWTSLVEIARFLLISLFLEDSRTAIKGTAGVEHSAKRIVSMEMSLDDMKTVKRAVGGTINDVLLGIVSAGVGRYLQQQGASKPVQRLRIHSSALVNTRKAPGMQELADMMNGSSKARWGNQMGYVLIPLTLKKCENTLDYVRLAKETSERKKLSLEACFTYGSSVLVTKIAGPQATASMVYRALTHTTFALSNVVGPLEQVAFCGNPITSITPTVVGQPQALCLHMQSYMGKAKLVATAATSVIPDPQVLLQHCKDALQEMKDAAKLIQQGFKVQLKCSAVLAPRRRGDLARVATQRVSMAEAIQLSRLSFNAAQPSLKGKRLQTVCMAHPRRVSMVAQQIRREIGEMLIMDKVLKHAILPESALGADLYLSSVTTVSDVEVSKDLQVAKVYISVFGDQRGKEIAIEGLKSQEKYVRMQLGRRMKIRRTPEVRFIEDDSFERGDRVLRILDRIKAERERKERGEGTEYDSEDEDGAAVSRLSNDEDGDLTDSEDDEKIIFVK